MKANELRIGNIVKDAKQDYQGVVTGILSDYLAQVTYPSGVTAKEYPEELAPIPLTEDWLLRAGFERDRTLSGISFHNFRFNDIELYAPDKEGWCAAYCSYDIFKLSIKYVHQLQNLYFALTGDELTFTDQHNPCTSNDPDDMCDNCNCWKHTRAMSS